MQSARLLADHEHAIDAFHLRDGAKKSSHNADASATRSAAE